MENRIVFYFTGTGNSLSVAEGLVEGGQLIDIASAKTQKYEADVIGFVYPTYCMEAPAIVRAFVTACSFEAKYTFAIATCGGQAGNAIAQIAKILEDKHGFLSYASSIVLPDNCILLKTAESKKQIMLDDEAGQVSQFAKDIADRKLQACKYSKMYNLATSGSWLFLKELAGLKKKKATSACVSCGLCQRQCPVGNISMVGGKITFGNSCQQCFRCIHICPKEAIRFGLIKVNYKSKYVHTALQRKIKRSENGFN